MANEFKVKKGLIAYGSASTVLDIQGTQGQLLSTYDSLSGSLLSVRDISGYPQFEVYSDGAVKMPYLTSVSQSNVVTIDTTTGQLYYTSSISTGYIQGTYAPEATTVTANIVSVTPGINGNKLYYSQTGNHVTVYGDITVNTNATGDTKFKLTLPVTPSNFEYLGDATGMIVQQGNTGTKINVGSVYAEITKGNVFVEFYEGNTPDATDYMLKFIYRVE